MDLNGHVFLLDKELQCLRQTGAAKTNLIEHSFEMNKTTNWHFDTDPSSTNIFQINQKFRCSFVTIFNGSCINLSVKFLRNSIYGICYMTEVNYELSKLQANPRQLPILSYMHIFRADIFNHHHYESKC